MCTPRHLVGFLAAAGACALLGAWWLWTEAAPGEHHRPVGVIDGLCMGYISNRWPMYVICTYQHVRVVGMLI